MRINIYPKIFFYLSISISFLYLFVLFCDYNNGENIKIKIYDIDKEIKDLILDEHKKINMKYILQWTLAKNIPFVYMGKGRSGFIERNCTSTNCFVTDDRNFFGDYTKFDVIAFAGPEVVHMSKDALPTKRSPHQKFVFASIESSDYYPACESHLNGFFNWTWTYRLDSDEEWGYIYIRDNKNRIIGPKKDMSWIALNDMKPTNNDVKEKLREKSKAAAWFVSNCDARSDRRRFVLKLQKELKRYGLEIDIYGGCGNLSCSHEKEEECNDMIEKHYYFYLSFENSFAEDYVTEKLLYPLQNLAVPIVYGGADYSRFMPDGIYLNARELGAEALAETMNKLIKNPDEYAEYFKWRNHYSYHNRSENLETDDYCRFCSMLNDQELMKKTTVYENLQDWWNPPSRC